MNTNAQTQPRITLADLLARGLIWTAKHERAATARCAQLAEQLAEVGQAEAKI